MNRELNFVLEVLQDKPSIPEKGLDWYWILGFLELNKIGGYFFNKTKPRSFLERDFICC